MIAILTILTCLILRSTPSVIGTIIQVRLGQVVIMKPLMLPQTSSSDSVLLKSPGMTAYSSSARCDAASLNSCSVQFSSTLSASLVFLVCRVFSPIFVSQSREFFPPTARPSNSSGDCRMWAVLVKSTGNWCGKIVAEESADCLLFQTKWFCVDLTNCKCLLLSFCYIFTR